MFPNYNTFHFTFISLIITKMYVIEIFYIILYLQYILKKGKYIISPPTSLSCVRLGRTVLSKTIYSI